METLKADSVTHIVMDTSRGWVTRTYKVGTRIMEEMELYLVTEIRVTDSFGQFHVEVELEEFGWRWIEHITEITFRNAEDRTVQNDKSRDQEDC